MIRLDPKTMKAVEKAAAVNRAAGAWVAPAPFESQIVLPDDAPVPPDDSPTSPEMQAWVAKHAKDAPQQ